MSGLLDDFLSDCVSDCINGSSAPRSTPETLRRFQSAVDRLHEYLRRACDPLVSEMVHEVAAGTAAYYAQHAATLLHLMESADEANELARRDGR